MFQLLFLLIILVIYFLPTIVAYSKNHTNTLAIFILNLFLGYTLIGWVVALIWAVYKKDDVLSLKKKDVVKSKKKK